MLLLAAVVLSIFVYGVISSMLGSLLPTLGFTGDQNGTLALTQATGLAIASFTSGPLIENRGKKTAMVAGLAALSTALWVMPGASGNFRMAAAFWFLLGIGGGMMATASNSLISDIGGARRSSILNSANLFFGLGLMVTPYLAAHVFESDVRGLCYFGAALASITLTLHALIRVPPPDHKQRFSVAEAVGLLKIPILRWFAVLAFLYVACEVGMSNWLVKYLIAKGVERDDALQILSLGFALGLLIGRIAAWWILKHVTAANVALGGSVLMALSTLWVLLSGGNTTVVMAAVFCTGFAMGPVYPTVLGMVGDAFPKSTASAMGSVITCGWIGLAVSSRLIGAIAGANEGRLSQALFVFPLFSLAMIGVSFALRKAADPKPFRNYRTSL